MRGAQLTTPEFNPVNPAERGAGGFDLFAFLEADLAESRRNISILEQARVVEPATELPLVDNTIVSPELKQPNIKRGVSNDRLNLFAFLEADLAEANANIAELESQIVSETESLISGQDTTEIEANAHTPLATLLFMSEPATVKITQPEQHSAAAVLAVERKLLHGWRAKAVGVVAVVATIVMGGLSVSLDEDPGREEARAMVEIDEIAEATPALAVSFPTQADSGMTIEAPTPEPFRPRPGDIVGVLKIPAICEEIQVLEYSEQEELDNLGGTGRATVEIMNPDPTPTEHCENIAAHERQVEAETGLQYYTRAERGDAIDAQPVAGHMTSIKGEGSYTSALPGDEGHAVIDGHGSTFSAPFADLNVLKLGDEVIFEREDGVITTFIVTEHEVLSKDDIDGIYNYSHPDSKTAATLMNCSYGDGRTGSSDFRGLVRMIKKA